MGLVVAESPSMEIGKIIVGVDFSELSDIAVQEAVNVCRHLGCEIVLAHVGPVVTVAKKPSVVPSVQQWERMLSEQAHEDRERLEALYQNLVGQGLRVSKVTVEGLVAETLTLVAEQEAADLVVVGTHGRTGAQRVLMGSVARETVRSCRSSVLVSRAPVAGAGGFAKILVATDFSPHAEEALRWAMSLAAPGGSVEVLHFGTMPAALGQASFGAGRAALDQGRDDYQEQAARQGKALLAAHGREGVDLRFESLQGAPVAGIVDRLKQASADRPYDLLVGGSHGLRGFRRFFLGSVAEDLVLHAPCSTLVVHLKADE